MTITGVTASSSLYQAMSTNPIVQVKQDVQQGVQGARRGHGHHHHRQQKPGEMQQSGASNSDSSFASLIQGSTYSSQGTVAANTDSTSSSTPSVSVNVLS